MLALLPMALAAAVAAPPALTDAQLVGVLGEIQQHNRHPVPMPGPKRRAALLSGEVVKLRLPSEDGGPVGAMGLVISPLPQAEVWLGTCDEDLGDGADEVISHHLPTQGDEMFRWYGYIDMPKPVTDRHFLIRTTVNRTMEAATKGRVWARHWDIEPGGREIARALVAAGQVPGLQLDRFDDALWVGENTGSWIVASLPDGRSLLAYQATASLGGSFPDGLVNQYVYWGLDRILETVLEQASRVRGHYVAGHKPLQGGDGQPLPPRPRRGGGAPEPG